MTDFLDHVSKHVGGDAVRVTVIDVVGSTPRECGAGMLVGRYGVLGSIGGGRLEYDCIGRARAMLDDVETDAAREIGIVRSVDVIPLGPALGQCCGGTVRVLFECYREEDLADIATQATGADIAIMVRPVSSGKASIVVTTSQTDTGVSPKIAEVIHSMLAGMYSAPIAVERDDVLGATYLIEQIKRCRSPLFVYGAGHVGRAVVGIAAELDFAVHWVDTNGDRFPSEIPDGVERVVARAPAIVARAARADAFHLVLTYSHAIDLDICHAVLTGAGFGFLGLIGSATKRARFERRLRDTGVPEGALSRLTCPIGTGAIKGKAPMTIAVSAMAQIIEAHERIAEHMQEGSAHGADQRLSA